MTKELRDTHTECYFGKIYGAAEKIYAFDSTATESYPNFCMNYGFITTINSTVKISFRLTAVPYINMDEEDSVVASNTQEVASGLAEKSTLEENRHQNFSDIPDSVKFNNTQEQEKNMIGAVL